MRIVSNNWYLCEQVWRYGGRGEKYTRAFYTFLYELLEPRVKVREKCYVFFSFLDDTIRSRKRKEDSRKWERKRKYRRQELYRCIQFFPSSKRYSSKKKKIKKTPCAREEIRANGKGSFARCWVRVRLIGGAVVSVGETFAGLDRALLYSEVSWRAPCGSLDRSSFGLGRAEKKSRWCVLGSAHDLLHRETWAWFVPLAVPWRGNEVFDWISSSTVVGSRIEGYTQDDTVPSENRY